MYRLHTILLHLGTANGGHYKAYVRDCVHESQWLECNDSSVTELQLSDPNNNQDIRDTNISGRDNKHFSINDDNIRRNAYVLMYKKVPENWKELGSELGITEASTQIKRCEQAIHQVLKDKINEENITSVKLRRLYEIHQKIVDIKVLFKIPQYTSTEGNNSENVSLYVYLTDSLEIVLKKVIEVIHTKYPDFMINIDDSYQQSCRLRLYYEHKNQLGETFGGREQFNLSDLLGNINIDNFSKNNKIVFFLETKNVNDKSPFVEYNPREMSLRLLLWTKSIQKAFNTSNLTTNESSTILRMLLSNYSSQTIVTESGDDDRNSNSAVIKSTYDYLCSQIKEVIIDGEDKAMVHTLRDKSYNEYEKIGLDERHNTNEVTLDKNMMSLIYCNDRGNITEIKLDDDNKTLKFDYGICPYDLVFVDYPSSYDVLSKGGVNGTTDSVGDNISRRVSAFETLKSLKQLIRIYFNDPRVPFVVASSTTSVGVGEEVGCTGVGYTGNGVGEGVGEGGKRR